LRLDVLIAPGAGFDNIAIIVAAEDIVMIKVSKASIEINR
jgi:hypothetical protein